MSDADLMYLEQVFVELFQRGGDLSQWYLTPAPYYFPDMVGYFALRPLVPDVFWAFYVFGIFQSTAVLVLAMVLTYRITGSKSAVLLTESSCLGGLALGLFGVSPFKFLYSPTYHIGTLLIGLALLTLTSGLLKSRSSASALSVFSSPSESLPTSSSSSCSSCLCVSHMVHVQDPNTARYLVTIVWLPLTFLWLPLETNLTGWKPAVPLCGLVLAVALAALSATRPADRFVEPTRCPEWVEVLDSHIETLGEEGRHLRHGVSTTGRPKWPLATANGASRSPSTSRI